MEQTAKPTTIHIATDHAGFSHKESVRNWLLEEGYEVVDHGACTYDELDDFTDFVQHVGRAVATDRNSKGIVFGGSGQGEAMAVNRFNGVRATVFYGGDENIVKLSRQHNDANVLSIGARFVDADASKRVIWDWLHTEPLTNEKYARRNLKLDTLD